MIPPHTFFYNFFKDNTFFVVGNTIYNPNQSPNSDSAMAVGEKKFYFTEGLKLSKLEALYFQNKDFELKEYGNNQLKKILDDEKKVNKDYYQLGQELEFVEFVFYDLLKNREKQKEIKIISVEKDTCLIDSLFKYDCFVWNGRLYKLEKGKNDSSSIRINNYCYSIGARLETSLEDLEEDYLKSIEEKVSSQLTKGQESLLSKLKGLKEKKGLISLLNRGEFFDAKEKIGFKKDSKGFFVTTKSQKTYVLYEPSNGKYYRFGEALIGIRLTKRGKNIEWHDPIIINPYIHPALPSENYVPYQRICPGDYDYKKEADGKSLDEAVKLLLGKARSFIERGYYGVNGAHHSLTKKHFQSLETKDFNPREVTNK